MEMKKLTLKRMTGLARFARRAARRLGSLRLAIVLLLGLAAVIGFATFLEADHGRDYAQHVVYHSGWFVGLLGLLGVNIFFAAIGKWPWKRHQIGFVTTHCGLLVLLAGSIQSFMYGVEAHVTLAEGASTTTMRVPQQSRITAAWLDRPEEAPYEFTFQPGPVDWRKGTRLDMGELDGVGVRVRHYYSKAQAVEEWVPDESRAGGPLVRFALTGPKGSTPVEQSLIDLDFGDEMFVGPLRLQLQRAESDLMLEHFLKPPAGPLGNKGVLLAYYGNRFERIPIDDGIGKKVRFAETGVSVEIAEYLPNAKPDGRGRFRTIDSDPRNPMLELKVYFPGTQQPMRQLAFAKSPLLNLDGVDGLACPVRFQYCHPAIKASAGLELIQAKNGKLHARTVTESGTVPHGELVAGGTLSLAGNFNFTVVEHVPHVRQRIIFEPADVGSDEKPKSGSAAEIEVTIAGKKHTIWLEQDHPNRGAGTLLTPEGAMRVSFSHATEPLGFRLTLLKFQRDVNPGGAGNAAFSSVVRLVDEDRGVDEERTVSMNEPLTYGGLTFYQSSFDDPGHGTKTSTFSVAHDPGRKAKYAGSLMICMGIAAMFYMRVYFFQGVPRFWRRQSASTEASSVPDPEVQPAMPQEPRNEELVSTAVASTAIKEVSNI